MIEMTVILFIRRLMKQSPIFARTYDFIAWLIPLTIKFPHSQRFVMAAALQREAIRFQELLIEASHQGDGNHLLLSADAELDKVRTHIRLSLEMGLIQPAQYEHAARLMTEIGKLLGGWMKTVQA
jgi:four helix bundle protein